MSDSPVDPLLSKRATSALFHRFYTMLRLLLLATLMGAASAMCPDSCSGHGTCGCYDMCTCYAGYQGNDCASRECESERISGRFPTEDAGCRMLGAAAEGVGVAVAAGCCARDGGAATTAGVRPLIFGPGISRPHAKARGVRMWSVAGGRSGLSQPSRGFIGAHGCTKTAITLRAHHHRSTRA